MNDQDRLRRHLPLFNMMNGPEEKFLWDKICLTPPVHAHTQLGAYIAMYVLPDGDTEFVFVGVGGTIQEASFALAIYTMDPLHAFAADRMRERDRVLGQNNAWPSPDDLDYVGWLTVKAGEVLPQDDADNRLPVAYAALHSILGEHRTHLDFFCHKELPAESLWKAFRREVAQGLIGL